MMADQGYGCIWGDCTAPVAVILTDLTNGASVSLCEEHEGPGLIPIVAGCLGVDATDLYGSIERFLDREKRKADKALADARAADAAQGSEGPPASGDDDRLPDPENAVTGMTPGAASLSTAEVAT